MFSKIIFLFISSKLVCSCWTRLKPDWPQGVQASDYHLRCIFSSLESHLNSDVEIPLLVKAIPDVKCRMFGFFAFFFLIYCFLPKVILDISLAWDMSFWGYGSIFKPVQFLVHKSVWWCVLAYRAYFCLLTNNLYSFLSFFLVLCLFTYNLYSSICVSAPQLGSILGF